MTIKHERSEMIDNSSKYNDRLREYRDLISRLQPSKQRTDNRTSISAEIARERKLKNDDTAQDIKLKKETLDRLFVLLAVETFVIFGFALLQATKWLNFTLEEWSFKLLTTVTITQITLMLFVAVSYLFPKKHS